MTKGIDIKAMIAFRHEGNTWQECADKFGITWAARAKVLYDRYTDLNERIPVKRKRRPNGSSWVKAAQLPSADQNAVGGPSGATGAVKPQTRYTAEATDEEVAQAQRVVYCERHIECIDQYRHAAKCPFTKA
jgi:hypothetical protein